MVDVSRELRTQRRVRRPDVRLSPVAEVTGYGRVELAAGGGDTVEPGAARGLQIFSNRTVVCDELFDDCAGATGQRIMLGLYAAHGLHGFERRALGQNMPDQNDGGDGGEPKRKPAADSETPSGPPHGTCPGLAVYRRRCRDLARWSAMCRFGGGFVHTT